VTDLERFFQHLVQTLAAGDPTRLQQPVPLKEIRESLVPYRTHRRALQLESSEEYELVLMRLCAGEGGLATTEPPEVRTEFEIEVGSSNPDLGLVERREKAVLRLNPRAAERALRPAAELAHARYQPPAPAAQAKPSTPAKTKPRVRSAEPAPTPSQTFNSRCARCGAGLPQGRKVNFCPQCGQNLALSRCPQCQAELDAAWRHCVNCGASVTPG
jgi:Double zinc ribbon